MTASLSGNLRAFRAISSPRSSLRASSSWIACLDTMVCVPPQLDAGLAWQVGPPLAEPVQASSTAAARRTDSILPYFGRRYMLWPGWVYLGLSTPAGLDWKYEWVAREGRDEEPA